ncbi:MAG: polysaccharide biosynthesis C-terminal domain-containing protein [Saprospiraceae bacterium]|nr:polysaccharide biosynthesis C-terminal domain-containing protein [Saprospiraceae bacterium]
MRITTTTALQFNQVLRQGSFILISILLAKSSLTTFDIGVYETLLFIGTAMSYFWLNALIQSSLTFTPSVNTAEKPKTVFNIFLIFNAFSLLLCLILWTFKPFIISFFAGKSELPFYDLYVFSLLLSFPPLLLESLWTVQNTPLSILAYSLVSHLLLPFAIVLPLWFYMPFIYSFYGMIGVASIRYIWLVVHILCTYGFFSIDVKIIRLFLTLSLPLMAYSFLNGFVTSFTAWIVQWFYEGDNMVFAVFRYGAREFPLSLALATGLSNSMIPILTETTQVGMQLLKQKSERLWHILFPTSIGLMLTAKFLFPLVFNPSFTQSADIFCLFLLLLTSRALFPQSILLALKETKTMLFISIIETLSIIILSFLLIFPLGTEGVAWALVIGFLIEKLLIALFLKQKHNISMSDYTNIRLYTVYSLFLLVSYALSKLL